MDTVGKQEKTVPGKEIANIKAPEWWFAFFVADKETSTARTRRVGRVWEMRLARHPATRAHGVWDLILNEMCSHWVLFYFEIILD